MEESQDEREPHTGEKKGDQSKCNGKKGGLRSERGKVPRKGGKACKVNLRRRMHEQVSEHKSSPVRFAEFWFHSKSGQS